MTFKALPLSAFLAATLSFSTVVSSFEPVHAATQLQQVATTGEFQPTGVAVTRTGRMFVNFPRWEGPYQYAVAEIAKDGKLIPYPNADWNSWKPGQTPGNKFVCVQSVTVDDKGMLWILDPAAPGLGDVIKGGPKLLKIDPSTNKIVQTIKFDEISAPRKSYLNDVRVDTGRNVAYVTDSGMGAIVVVDLQSGKSWRVLENHPSTKAEPGFKLMVNGKDLRDEKGYVPQFNADGIELSKDGNTLYYHALTGQALYSVETSALLNNTLTDIQRDSQISKLGLTGPTDGLWLDNNSNLYHSHFPDNSIKRFNLKSKALETVATDKDLFWPDSFAADANGNIVVTASQIQHMSKFNQGKSQKQLPYKLFKFKP